MSPAPEQEPFGNRLAISIPVVDGVMTSRAIDRITKPFVDGIVATTWQLVVPTPPLNSWNDDGVASATWSCLPSVTLAFVEPLPPWIVTRSVTALATRGTTSDPTTTAPTSNHAVLLRPMR